MRCAGLEPIPSSGCHLGGCSRYLHPGDALQMGEGPRQDLRPLPGPYSSAEWLGVGLSVAVPPPMLAPCSALMRRRPRPSVGCSMKAANCSPRSTPAALPRHHGQCCRQALREDDCELETVASPAPEANPDMSDQIIDALMACAIHADAARSHPLVGWIVMQDQPDYPDEMIACLVTDTPRPTSCEATRWLRCRPNCRLAWSESNASRPTRQRWWKLGFLGNRPPMTRLA